MALERSWALRFSRGTYSRWPTVWRRLEYYRGSALCYLGKLLQDESTKVPEDLTRKYRAYVLIRSHDGMLVNDFSFQISGMQESECLSTQITSSFHKNESQSHFVSPIKIFKMKLEPDCCYSSIISSHLL